MILQKFLFCENNFSRKYLPQGIIFIVSGQYLLFFFLIVASLLEILDWEGTNAESLKWGIDSIFDEKEGKIPIKSYCTKLISMTTDGASVNTKHMSGLMKRLASDREWLIKIHSFSHYVELTVIDAFLESWSNEIDIFYSSIYFLFKSQGGHSTKEKCLLHSYHRICLSLKFSQNSKMFHRPLFPGVTPEWHRTTGIPLCVIPASL